MPLYPQDANVGLSASVDREQSQLKVRDPSSRVLMDFYRRTGSQSVGCF